MSIYYPEARVTARPGVLLDANVVSGVAKESLVGGRVLRFDSGGLVHSDHINGGFAGFLLDVGASPGKRVDFISEGIIEMDDWSNVTGSAKLESGKSYFLGLDGQISTVAPAFGHLLSVAQALSERELQVGLKLKVKL